MNYENTKDKLWKLIQEYKPRKSWTTKLSEIFENRTIEAIECYDENHDGYDVIMFPIANFLDGELLEIAVPRFYAKKFFADGKLYEVDGYLFAPIFYHPSYGAVFRDDLIAKICAKENILTFSDL